MNYDDTITFRLKEIDNQYKQAIYRKIDEAVLNKQNPSTVK